MINAIDFTEYAETYFVETKDGKSWDKISANSPIEAARTVKGDAVKCKKSNSTIAVISNEWRFKKSVKWNYYN